jgi:hypothetical protein
MPRFFGYCSKVIIFATIKMARLLNKRLRIRVIKTPFVYSISIFSLKFHYTSTLTPGQIIKSQSGYLP